MRDDSKTGKLYLIGAGPGDPELLTLKAVRVLGQCDVVLYDRLVNKAILQHAKPSAELIYVGKHPGEQERAQNEIFELIRRHAFRGQTVARLKGGDPLVFGRGAEEWFLALRDHIEVEVIPGVTSAIAVPGLAGIPLTYRGVSQSFVIITGHCHEGRSDEWRRYVEVDTLVVLMGVRNREFIARSLIAAGRRPEEPVAFVMRGTMAGEQVAESTLEDVAAGRTDIQPPAVFVIGEVVRLRSKFRESQRRRGPAL
ncbi:MAG: uroporphyrinogen-III C-methyltransferase [Acidobacteriaceae bacterium]|nr:uroporphyrinogen-III C-methyltransferase [Acidobacteriaceae bacterium]MBV9500400.1 uroporphyrinogen-III C-methyltransferase [Acidobacteriaceae bacterium]